ncbi:MAG: TlpA family protein disulfide reductase [Dehalococcoidia bacterium]|nr:TlpA family protein disulfide reductase [Dehalococcoidia bacterium]
MASRMSKKTWLIIITIVIVLVVTVVGIILSRNSTNSPSDITLPIITWNETTLSELEGTPVVLNFWSIACSWCRYQLPFLEAIAQQNEGGLEVIAVNVADNAARIQTFFGDYEPTMIIALDNNGEAFVDYCLAYNNTRKSIPFTLFVDSEGIVQHVKIGAFMNEDELWDTLHDVFEL